MSLRKTSYEASPGGHEESRITWTGLLASAWQGRACATEEFGVFHHQSQVILRLLERRMKGSAVDFRR